MIIAGLLTAVLLIIFGLYAKDSNAIDAEKWARVPGSVRDWIPVVKDIAARYNVPVEIALGVLWVENKGNMYPRGQDGEYGIMQVKEIAVQDLRLNGYKVPENWRTDPVDNITVGIQFLDLQNKPKRANGDWNETIRAYNQGYKGKDASLRQSRRADEYLQKVKSRIEMMPI